MSKNKPNGFYMFMRELKERDSRYKFYAMEKMVAVADPLWKELSEERREVYTERAKELRGLCKNDMSKKYDSQGRCLEDKMRSVHEQEAEIRRKIEEVKDMVQFLHGGRLLDTYFMVAHLNSFLEIQDEDKYVPSELGICEFSLRDGVRRKFHVIFDPGYIEPGYTLLMKEQSESYHHIPLDFAGGEKSHTRVYTDVVSFFKGSRRKPCVFFTMPDNKPLNNSITAMERAFQKLYTFGNPDADPESWKDFFQIYPLQYLLQHLRNQVRYEFGPADEDGEKLPIYDGPAMPLSVLEHSYYNNERGVACQLHEKVDFVDSCSLAKAIYCVYTVCNDCFGDLNIPMIPGKHRSYPPDYDEKNIEHFAMMSLNDGPESHLMTPNRVEQDAGSGSVGSSGAPWARSGPNVTSSYSVFDEGGFPSLGSQRQEGREARGRGGEPKKEKGKGTRERGRGNGY